MKRLLAATMLACIALPALAQEPALGRLFLTPEQRAALDNARRNKIRAEAIAATVETKPKIPAARSVTINGVVQRSDGESVIWVNGKATDGKMDDGMRIVVSPSSQGTVVVREPDKGRRIELRVGQRADLLTGRVDDAYERRRRAERQLEKHPPGSSTAPLAARKNRSGGRYPAREGDDPIKEPDERDAPPREQEKAAQ